MSLATCHAEWCKRRFRKPPCAWTGDLIIPNNAAIRLLPIDLLAPIGTQRRGNVHARLFRRMFSQNALTQVEALASRVGPEKHAYTAWNLGPCHGLLHNEYACLLVGIASMSVDQIIGRQAVWQ
ncbi:hypothetical protein H4R24_004588 [Coemansia sp. RSA 988]|nr:hypothetical protein H4R24_004588 [Coemansia sp. RSA 988]